MRILIVCPCPIQLELGAVQVHLNLAASLRELGHTVRVWSPFPLREVHFAASVLKMRTMLGSFLRSGEVFDVVDCPAYLLRGSFVDTKTTWVARSVQPDILYFWESLRGQARSSVGAMTRTAARTAWMAGIAALIQRGWAVSDVVMCFGRTERAWISDWFPWLRPKLRSYDGAISEADRAELASVRHARRPRSENQPVRYLWIARWADHKGTDTLLAFLRARVAEGTNERFTIAGCGPIGAQALAPLAHSGLVRAVPEFTRADLPGLLAAHDAGLFTSRVEGWGLVLNEMVESGLPVYATTAGGIDDIRSVLGPFIQNFPPPPGAPLPSPPSAEALARYEARFRWPTIAASYVASISSRVFQAPT
jgi:glycosyltransferase involved in cell wall biosynthesis